MSDPKCDLCLLNPARYVARRTIPATATRPVRYERWLSCIRCKDQAKRMKSRDIRFELIREQA